jgi:hypothetical protein
VLALVFGVTLSAAALPIDGARDGAINGSATPSVAPDGPAAPEGRPGTAGGDVAGATGRPRPVDAPRAGAEPGPVDAPSGAETATATTSAIKPGSINRASVEMSTTYSVGLNLNYGTRAISVDTTLMATNTSGASVDRLELNTIAARLGGLRLGTVTVDGRTATATVHDQTIVVRLGGILPVNETVKVRVTYRATLRSSLSGSSWLFTRTNGIANLYRWLPWVSRDVPFDRPNHGDPFITAVSPRVTVKVTADRPLVIATSGGRISTSGLTQTFEARNVRDFAITAAPDFKTGSRVVGNTTVRVWYRPGFPAVTALEQAARALSRMNSLLGTYPYREFKVVQSAGGYGMEAPGMIWIPTGVASSTLPYLVHHETAHQWFYGIVGGDQANEPYTDEAVTDFVARYALGSKRASRCSTSRLDLSIYRYTSGCYYEIVYIQGGNFLDDLRARMGSTAFWKGLRAWIGLNRYEIASTRSLLYTLDRYTSLDLRPRYEPRFPRLY